jgi:hypothetical protein
MTGRWRQRTPGGRKYFPLFSSLFFVFFFLVVSLFGQSGTLFAFASRH